MFVGVSPPPRSDGRNDAYLHMRGGALRNCPLEDGNAAGLTHSISDISR